MCSRGPPLAPINPIRVEGLTASKNLLESIANREKLEEG